MVKPFVPEDAPSQFLGTYTRLLLRTLGLINEEDLGSTVLFYRPKKKKLNKIIEDSSSLDDYAKYLQNRVVVSDRHPNTVISTFLKNFIVELSLKMNHHLQM